MTGKTLPFVSVIIPVLNGERTIRDCLVSLLRMDYPPDRRELVVVDNGSTDRTAEIIKCYPVAYVWEGKRGVSYARNRGIRASQAEILAFTDADCMVTTRWLGELTEGFDSDDVGVVVGEVVAYPPKTRAQRHTAMRRPLWQTSALSHPATPWFTSANAAFRREVFTKLGLFDHRFAGAGAEDIDFSWRFLQDRHFELRYRPKATVLHRHRASTRELFQQRKVYGQGQAILCRKYPKELSWGWSQELRAYKDLLLTALALVQAAMQTRLRGLGAPEGNFLYVELVRKLGERIGFIYGTVQRST